MEFNPDEVSLRRNAERERKILAEFISKLVISDNMSLKCLKALSSDVYETIHKPDLYINCLKVVKNIPWGLISPEIFNDGCWQKLKYAEITNPQKDIVFKIWHNSGLAPKIATAMRLYDGRDCPFCAEAEVRVCHYAFCSNFKPLWLIIFKILNISFCPTTLSTIIHGLDDRNDNLFIFYGLCTIYKAFIHVLNQFDDDFDAVKHFRQLVFCRILTEYQVSRRGGSLSFENFHRKWKKYKIFIIINNNIKLLTL